MEIILTSFRKGGSSKFGLADKFNASFAAMAVQQMGVGDFSPVDLRKFLSGKTVSVATSISSLTTNVNGTCSIKDLETMLQLVYLNLTAPRKDEGLFNGWKEKQKTAVQFMLADPTSAFVDSVFNFIYKNQPLAPVNFPKAEDFDRTDINQVMRIYKELTGDATDFTFILTGNLDAAAVQPLLCTYIGGLPAKGKSAQYVDNGVRPVNGVHDIKFTKGTEAKSFIFNYYSGEIAFSEDLRLATELVTEVLNIKIIEELREKIGGIYGGAVYGEIVRNPYPHYNLALQLPCGPENVEKLKVAASQEIEKMKSNGPEQKDLDKAKKAMIEKFKANIQDNRFWAQALQGIYLEGNHPESLLKYDQMVNALTVADIKKAAQLLFDGKNEIRAVLYPEKK